jgi:hypothetical protein
MEIKILQDTDWKYGEYVKGGYVLEKRESKSEFPSINQIEYSLLNLTTNQRIEILPNVEKYNIGDIVNVSVNRTYLYFVNIFEKNEKGTVSIMRYNIETGETEDLYSYNDTLREFNITKHLKLFVINDLYLLIQNEYLVKNISQTYAGFFKFELKMYNLKDNTEYMISDENFVKNGISDIVPLSENQAIIKTGFSLLEDNRYNALDKEECSLESLSFVNISQMMSDLIIGKNTITLEIIEQAYYTKTIPYIKKSGDYIIYSCVNNETKEEEVKFYNLSTKNIESCINQNVIRQSDLAKPYIINSEPYICIIKNEVISFLSLRTNKIEYKNSKGMKLRNVFDDTLLLTGISTSLLTKKVKSFFDIVSFPQGKLLHHEQNGYIDSFTDENRDIYVVVEG